MTNKEAIAILERLQEPEAWEPQISEDAYTALQMAIDALNDVPDRNVGDMISRQVALKEIEEWISALYENAHHEFASDGKMILNAIKHLPSAQPEPCEDCVSRKAVIRLLHSGYHSKSMIEEVKELPSAQPNWCDGCKWEYAFEYGECHRCKRNFNDMYEVKDEG